MSFQDLVQIHFFCIFVDMPGCLDLIQWPVSAQTATTTLQQVSVHSIIGSLPPMYFQPPILAIFLRLIFTSASPKWLSTKTISFAATTEEIGVVAWIAAAVLCAFGPFLITSVFSLFISIDSCIILRYKNDCNLCFFSNCVLFSVLAVCSYSSLHG